MNTTEQVRTKDEILAEISKYLIEAGEEIAELMNEDHDLHEIRADQLLSMLSSLKWEVGDTYTYGGGHGWIDEISPHAKAEHEEVYGK